MAAIKEQVTETLLGSKEEGDTSKELRQDFMTNAVQDPETGELYLGKEQFVNAIAPESEDYVSVLAIAS